LFLLFIAALPEAGLAQEPYPDRYSSERYLALPGHFSLELGAKFMGRDIDEEGGACCFATDATATSTRLLAKLAVDITPNFQIYGLAGGTDLDIDEFNDFYANLSFSYKDGFAYGGGIKISFYPDTFGGPAKLFIDASYLRFQAKDSIIIPSGPFIGPADEEITWQEGVIKFGVAGRQGFFEPYGGFRYLS
jgi:hypothetical protein